MTNKFLESSQLILDLSALGFVAANVLDLS